MIHFTDQLEVLQCSASLADEALSSYSVMIKYTDMQNELLHLKQHGL